MDDIERLLKEALNLPPADRTALTFRLLLSLDETGERLSEEEWLAVWRLEFVRRMRAYDCGEVVLADWLDLLARMGALLADARVQKAWADAGWQAAEQWGRENPY